MKRFLLLGLFILNTLCFFSQGIKFEHGNWPSVLKRAKKENKPIFVNITCSSCIPSLWMTDEVFTRKEVGDAYNTKFICYSLNVCDRKRMNFPYPIDIHPASLFIKPDGTLLLCSFKNLNVEELIGLSESGLKEKENTKPLPVWEKEYSEHDTDAPFILSYMEQRERIGFSNTSLLDQYLQLIPEKERYSAQVINLYIKKKGCLIVNSFAYKNLLENRNRFATSVLPVIDNWLKEGVENSVANALFSHDQLSLDEATSAFESLSSIRGVMSEEELYLIHYKSVNNLDKYFQHASDYCNNYLMKMDFDSLQKADRANLQQFEEQLKSEQLEGLDSTTVSWLRNRLTTWSQIKISKRLNDMAWDVFSDSSDKKLLQNALSWSKRSVEMVKNIYNLDTYANILYKLGNKEEAVTILNEALNRTEKHSMENYVCEQSLQKMKSGKKTW